MRNDKDITQKILDAVKDLGVSVYIPAIERMKFTDTDDLWELGYNEAIDDVIAILKGER